jgi:hypothetical protein
MPREDRRIYFDYDETYKAIFALCVQRDFKKPQPGAIQSVEPLAEDPAKLSFKVVNQLEGTSSVSEYSRDFLAAALMLYCRSLSIPLPKSAQKSVELIQGSVILRVQI